MQAYSKIGGKLKTNKPIVRTLKIQQAIGNAFHFDAEQYSYDIPGVNLTRIPGISSLTGIKLISELGREFTEKFPSVKHFCSWLNFVPNNRISGGKILTSSVPKRKNFAGQSFRVSANTLSRSKGYLGDYFRWMRSKLGYNQAIIAVAHKLARIIYKMVQMGIEYDETIDWDKNINMLTMKQKLLKKRLAEIELELNLSCC